MSLTYNEAVEQTITAGEQIHQIVNGTATTEVTVEDGSKVPSVRKALLDNFYFKDPIAWQVGQTENVFNQLRQFTDGSWWYAPSATASNPISMGSTPIGDSLWKIYDFDAIGKLTPQIREALRRSYAGAGYNLVAGSFEVGGTLVNANDVLLQERTGKGFTGPAGPVAAGTNPASGGFVDKSQSLLRDIVYSPKIINIRQFLSVAVDANAAFEMAFDQVINIPRSPAFPAGGATIIFPDLTINRPVVVSKLGVRLVGESPGTVLTVDPEFTGDTGPDALGAWCFIADSKYTELQMDIYGVYIGDFVIDYQYNLNVKGILINGGRNTTTIGTINHQRAANTLVRLGKSSLTTDSITQGVRVDRQWMIHDGNPGQVIPAISCSAIDLSAANECSIIEPTIVPAPRWDIRMTPITIGSGTYQCGGNIIHDGCYSNIKSIQYVISDASGVIAGGELTTTDGHILIVQNVASNTISGITKSGSAYIPRSGDTITKSAGGTATITAVNYITPCVLLRNSWGSQLMPARAAENCSLYVEMNAGTSGSAVNCQGNRVWPTRQFSNTSSCYILAKLSQFNRVDIPTYVNAGVIENSANQCIIEMVQGGGTPRIKNLSSTSYIVGWSNSGMTITPGTSGSASTSLGGFGTISADVNGLNLLTTAQVRVRDSSGVTRIQIDTSKNVFIYDSNSTERLGITSDGKLLMRNLPTANPGTPGQVWKNGSVLNVV